MNKLLLLLLVSCASVSTPEKEIPSKVIEVLKPETEIIVDAVNVTKFTGFYDSEIAKAKKYIPKMNETIASKCFEDFMVNRKLIKTNGLSRIEVVNKLRTSRVDIELITYYKRFSKVAGYTYPGVNKIWLHRKYHKGASLCSEASNLFHETSHKFGFGHSYKSNHNRQ